ncbi:immunoglobulin-like domain-containing receptor 2 isoform X4 [Corythoichthys intestinalis]|uniref:immunoglobulin-like domain-containing receptor 2 isoform X4 n=1 Tax=Corythoichthys intestinalis TaxID=161448 RepID=UPI0025A57506|nr:immunoglobulin-like domain-containing receptor 2 isoform X4 [Corythoichthys intestinalis]
MTLYRLAVLLGALVCACNGVHVTVPEKRKLAMLFQSVVLPCHYDTVSTQAPVIQWWYKSYCHDRTHDSFNPQSSELGAKAQLDCADKGRTVRVVASAQGSSMTLAEYYKNRDISIVNKADLRIGQVQWGDGGVYFCKVVVADDLDGKDEGQVELLVLVYEAGKKGKSVPPVQMPVYPYYIPGVPTVLPVVPSAQPKLTSVASVASVPSIASIPLVENNLPGVRVRGYRPQPSQDYRGSMKVLFSAKVPTAKLAALQPTSLSELSSLHEGGNADFRHTYHTVQMKAMQPIVDVNDVDVGDRVPLRVAPLAQRSRHRRERDNYSDDELERRWHARSEHPQRKPLSRRACTGSLDELEEFARSYDSRGHRAERDYSPQRSRCRDEDGDCHGGSTLPLSQKRRGTWDGELSSRPPRHTEYDSTFLSQAMESKARGYRGGARPDDNSDTPSKGSSRGKGGNSYYSHSPSNRPEEDDPLPPYSECEAERYRRSNPNTDWYRTSESVRTEWYDASEPAVRYSSYSRPQHGTSLPPQEKDKRRNVNTALSRDNLIV